MISYYWIAVASHPESSLITIPKRRASDCPITLFTWETTKWLDYRATWQFHCFHLFWFHSHLYNMFFSLYFFTELFCFQWLYFNWHLNCFLCFHFKPFQVTRLQLWIIIKKKNLLSSTASTVNTHFTPNCSSSKTHLLSVHTLEFAFISFRNYTSTDPSGSFLTFFPSHFKWGSFRCLNFNFISFQMFPLQMFSSKYTYIFFRKFSLFYLNLISEGSQAEVDYFDCRNFQVSNI